MFLVSVTVLDLLKSSWHPHGWVIGGDLLGNEIEGRLEKLVCVKLKDSISY